MQLNGNSYFVMSLSLSSLFLLLCDLHYIYFIFYFCVNIRMRIKKKNEKINKHMEGRMFLCWYEILQNAKVVAFKKKRLLKNKINFTILNPLKDIKLFNHLVIIFIFFRTWFSFLVPSCLLLAGVFFNLHVIVIKMEKKGRQKSFFF